MFDKLFEALDKLDASIDKLTEYIAILLMIGSAIMILYAMAQLLMHLLLK